MSKRKFDADPTKSDSDDLDYGAASSPVSRSRGRSRKSKSATRNPIKRRKQTYGSDSEIEVDSDDISDEGSFAHSSEEEEEQLELNPKTGRSVRATAKKPVKYEEPSDEEIEEIDSDSDPLQPTPAARKRGRLSNKRNELVVKLKIPPFKMEGGRVTRTQTGSRRPSSRREPTPQAHGAMGTRRSSRISHDEGEPLVALTDSGRHEQVTRAATETPEPPVRRPTRGGKGLKKPPSAIMEASQEDSQPIPTEEQTTTETLRGDDEDIRTRLHVRRTSPDAEDEIAMEVVDEEEQVVQESMDEDDYAGPIQRGGRTLRAKRKASTPPTSPQQPLRKKSRARKSGGVEQSSDFEPEAEGDADVEDDVSDSEDDTNKYLKVDRGRSSNDESTTTRRSGRIAASQRSRSRRQKSDDDEVLDADEIADEAAELSEENRRRRREGKKPIRRTEIAYEVGRRSRGTKKIDYRIIRPEDAQRIEEPDEAEAPAGTPQRGKRGANPVRSLFSTMGPFGGAGGPQPIFGGLPGAMATGGVDSDSSDDEMVARGGQQGIGGTVGMTPTVPKPYEPISGPGGGPPGMGKLKDKKLLADADPLGVDTSVTFEGVGGLEAHINQLKEMVSLPLLYPEVFQQFHVTPPRGVLFHGPPGTGKTLLARALANSVSQQGSKKVTFYMRKGADALSKWVGEAEKQLRMLFEEARKNQPSIIFFDEIDGLAPVRSSKQEQIHASIVATLLALMDGMDGRGQVVVIGATNRPDSVDPALRRPGRFDREFYFPLPNPTARRAIIDIHTKGWDPPLKPAFKDQLAELTRGYGGADLRALCTEAALNAVQGTYPQLYSSDKKLIIEPKAIKVLAKDFMIAINKMVPASERSATSSAAPLKQDVEPLLRQSLETITQRVEEAIPRRRKATALEEAMYDDRDDQSGFEKENMLKRFESARIFRPRLLIRGTQGMGQQYLGAALLSKLEGLHVQNFDMATLQKDASRSVEAAIFQQFEEIKQHKPSVIFIPNIDIWYRTLTDSAVRTFIGLLRSLAPTDPVLLLGILEKGPPETSDEEFTQQVDEVEARMLRDLFGYSLKNQFELKRPDEPARLEYFTALIDNISKPPSDFPELESRKKRKLAELQVAPPPPVVPPSKAEEKWQKNEDRLTLNKLKLRIQPIMDQLKRQQYKRFNKPIVEDKDIQYLYDEQDPNVLTTDMTEEQKQAQLRPYEIDVDDKGIPGIREIATNKFYYNLELITIERRLANGYYKRPKDYTKDVKRLAKDAKVSGDADRIVRANEMLTTVTVDMDMLNHDATWATCIEECEAVYQREQERERKRLDKVREAERRGEDVPRIVPNVPPLTASKTTTDTSGPTVLAQVPSARPPLFPVTPSRLFGPGPSPNSNTYTTNGSHPSGLTNGSAVPSRPREDSEMLDSQADISDLQGQQPHASAGSPTRQPQSQLSQRGAHTQVPQGSQVEHIHNSASTTTSGQKTSDKSNRSSDRHSVNTQLTNGVHSGNPDFSTIPEADGGSELPDTQEQQYRSSQSQPPSAPNSQPMAPPIARAPISAMLNDPPGGIATEVATADPGRSAAEPPTRKIMDVEYFDRVLADLVRSSSGLSVEQLEQVNAAMMNVVWQERGNWNRNMVLKATLNAFNETVADIEACQAILDPSQRRR